VPTVETNGVELAYRIDGDGDETLVLVNGLADTKETWELQLPSFAERYRVVSYDNRGIGESSAPPGPYTTAQMAEDFAGLADALELERFHLLGVSMGGRPGVRDRPRRPAALRLLLLHLLLPGTVLPTHVRLLA
jgi:pimeloyl-ACP methyl ester carboxylesterase